MNSCPAHVEVYVPAARPQDHPFLARQELSALRYYGLRPGDAFLELECGDAGFLGRVAEELPGGTVTGI